MLGKIVLLKKIISTRMFVVLCAVFCLSIAFIKVHIKVESTLMGYKLGELKKTELALLEEQSRLKMQLSSITSKSQLEFLSDIPDVKYISKGGKKVAVNW